jgi:uncharacterized repeat protein (TIGR03803 family)
MSIWRSAPRESAGSTGSLVQVEHDLEVHPHFHLRNELMGAAIRLAKLIALAALAAVPPRAGARTLTTLYSFGGTINSGPDGALPDAGLLDHGGMLYGTTGQGGDAGHGTVYRLNPTTGAETVLHSFAGGTDGSNPYAGLTVHHGVLFGTTLYGGGGCSGGCGIVYNLTLATGAEQVLYTFKGPPDGNAPIGGVIYHHGTLYGTTTSGGNGCEFPGCGTVFEVDALSGAESVLHSFAGGSDGSTPNGLLTYLGGKLYGATFGGGLAGAGTVFVVDPTTGAESVLYSFTGGADGAYPPAGLAASGGTLYGTTLMGGANGAGTVFKIDIATHAETVLYNFAGGADGLEPEAAPVYHQDALYGTTQYGGGTGCNGNGCGTVFRVDAVTGAETVLAPVPGGSSGSYPFAPLLNRGGALYGTTLGGGAFSCGTVFKVAQ